jgi:hypothetical protein
MVPRGGFTRRRKDHQDTFVTGTSGSTATAQVAEANTVGECKRGVVAEGTRGLGPNSSQLGGPGMMQQLMTHHTRTETALGTSTIGK